MRAISKIINRTTLGPYWVMYDNECSFCCQIMRVINYCDAFDKIQWIDKNWDGDFPNEGRIKIEQTIVVFNPVTNRLYYKTDGVFRILMCVPFGFLIAWIFKIPGLSSFFDYLYTRVANKRKCSN